MFGRKKKDSESDWMSAQKASIGADVPGATVSASAAASGLAGPGGSDPAGIPGESVAAGIPGESVAATPNAGAGATPAEGAIEGQAAANALGAMLGTSVSIGGAGLPGVMQGGSVIDARNIAGLREEMLKAVSDLQSGSASGQAELQAVVQKAMSGGSVLSAGSAAPGVSPSAPAPAAEDPLDKLEKLNNLKQSGVLTDAEFQAAKAKILSQT